MELQLYTTGIQQARAIRREAKMRLCEADMLTDRLNLQRQEALHRIRLWALFRTLRRESTSTPSHRSPRDLTDEEDPTRPRHVPALPSHQNEEAPVQSASGRMGAHRAPPAASQRKRSPGDLWMGRATSIRVELTAPPAQQAQDSASEPTGGLMAPQHGPLDDWFMTAVQGGPSLPTATVPPVHLDQAISPVRHGNPSPPAASLGSLAYKPSGHNEEANRSLRKRHRCGNGRRASPPARTILEEDEERDSNYLGETPPIETAATMSARSTPLAQTPRPVLNPEEENLLEKALLLPNSDEE